MNDTAFDPTSLITAFVKQGGVVQNGLGVLFAVGWGTFLYLQNKQKVKTEEHLEAKLSSEQSAVTELKQEVCLYLSRPGCKHEHRIAVIMKLRRCVGCVLLPICLFGFV